MMRSMFAGVSGLRSHQVMMDVVGNNIANVNTVGFKASRVVFSDALSQLIRGASGGLGEATAGVNPQQVGLGVKVGSIDIVHSQGGSQLTGRSTDVAIQGDGFFIFRIGTEQVYGRAGSFSFDQNGNLVDPSGAVVQGWNADNAGNIVTNAPVADIKIPLSTTIPPTATTEVELAGNLSSQSLTTDPPVITSISVNDGQGGTHSVSFEFTKTADNAWDMAVIHPDGSTIATTALTFDPGTGTLSSPAAAPSYTFSPPGGAAAITFSLDLAQLSQFGGTSTAAAVSHNGSSTGFLRSFAIADDGTLSGVFSNGKSLSLAKLGMSTFTNPGGLVKAGDSHYRQSSSSGNAVIGTPGTGTRGSMSAGTLEMSNVDLSQEFTNLIVAQRGFQANSRIISTSDELLQDLVNLKR